MTHDDDKADEFHIAPREEEEKNEDNKAMFKRDLIANSHGFKFSEDFMNQNNLTQKSKNQQIEEVNGTQLSETVAENRANFLSKDHERAK